MNDTYRIYIYWFQTSNCNDIKNYAHSALTRALAKFKLAAITEIMQYTVPVLHKKGLIICYVNNFWHYMSGEERAGLRLRVLRM